MSPFKQTSEQKVLEWTLDSLGASLAQGSPAPTPAPLRGGAVRHWRVSAAPLGSGHSRRPLPTAPVLPEVGQRLPLPPGLVGLATLLET